MNLWIYRLYSDNKSKISKGIGIICKARRLLNNKTMLTLYYSFIYPYFNYALEVWGNTINKHLDVLIKLQKRAIRIVTSSPRLEHTEPLFRELKTLQLEKLYVFKVGLTMFKVWHCLIPESFTSLFVCNNAIHSYNTRQSLLFHVPKARTDYMKRAISNRGVHIWNYLCSKLSTDCSYLSFKQSIKRFLLINDDMSFMLWYNYLFLHTPLPKCISRLIMCIHIYGFVI